MKRLIILLGFLLLCLYGDTKNEVYKPHEDIETRLDFWKAHAYVELKLMNYRVNKIIKTQ